MKREIHIGDIVKQQLNLQQRSIAWLAYKIKSDRSNLWKKLNKHDLSTDLLNKISKAMNVDIYEIIAASHKQ